MHKKNILLGLLIAVGLLPTPALANPADFQQISIGLDPLYARGRDDLSAPLVWQGPGAALSLGYANQRGATRRFLEASLGLAAIRNRYDHLGAMLGLSGRAGQEHVVLEWTPGQSIALGGALRWDTSALYLVQWDDSYAYWLTQLALAPRLAHYSRLAPDQELGVTLEWPLLGWVSRPPASRTYKIDPLDRPFTLIPWMHQAPVGAGPTELVAPSLGLTWRRSAQRGWGYQLGATYGLATYPRPEPVWHERFLVRAEITHGF